MVLSVRCGSGVFHPRWRRSGWLSARAQQQLRAAVHQLHQRNAAAAVQRPRVRGGDGGVRAGGGGRGARGFRGALSCLATSIPSTLSIAGLGVRTVSQEGPAPLLREGSNRRMGKFDFFLGSWGPPLRISPGTQILLAILKKVKYAGVKSPKFQFGVFFLR